MIDATCTICGSDGPHPVIDDSDPERHLVLAECRDCYSDFEVEVM